MHRIEYNPKTAYTRCGGGKGGGETRTPATQKVLLRVSAKCVATASQHGKKKKKKRAHEPTSAYLGKKEKKGNQKTLQTTLAHEGVRGKKKQKREKTKHHSCSLREGKRGEAGGDRPDTTPSLFQSAGKKKEKKRKP